MTKTTTQSLTIIRLYNLGFMGGRREGALTIDGQYKVITDGNEFVIAKFGGYGNLTSFPEVKEQKTEVLTDNEYRYVHDALMEQYRRYSKKTSDNELEASEIKMFNEGTRYKIQDGRISANIDYGDLVKNLDTGDVFKVDGGHDVQYINRNFKYKLVERELHPEAVTIEEFIKKNEAVNPFEGWTKIEAMPKKNKSFLAERYIINGETFNIIKDYSGNGRYIIETPTGEVYEKRSSISKPFYDTIDILVGHVTTKYKDGCPYNHAYKSVKHEQVYGFTTSFIADRFIEFKEPKSYDYNTRLTHL